MTETTTMTEQELYQVKAMFDWAPKPEGGLGLRKGDIISVFEKINEHWLRGRNTNTRRNGQFPSSYTEEITKNDLQSLKDEEGQSTAMVIHQPQEQTQAPLSTALQVTPSPQELQLFSMFAQGLSGNTAMSSPYHMMAAQQRLLQQQQQMPQHMYLPSNFLAASNACQPWPPQSISSGGAPIILGNGNNSNSNNINNYYGPQFQDAAHLSYDNSRSYHDERDLHSEEQYNHHESNDNRRDERDNRHYEFDNRRDQRDNRQYKFDNRRDQRDNRSYDNRRASHDNRREYRGDYVDQGDRSYGGRGFGGRPGGPRRVT